MIRRMVTIMNYDVDTCRALNNDFAESLRIVMSRQFSVFVGWCNNVSKVNW